MRKGNPSHRNTPYPVSRLAPPMELVDLAREIAEADHAIDITLHAKLATIANQIRALKQEAAEILSKARQDRTLHRAQCGFAKIPGKVYHLYQREDGGCYFSMLSPEEWGGEPPHPYQGSFRLEPDMSWTRVSGDPVRKGEEAPSPPAGAGGDSP